MQLGPFVGTKTCIGCSVVGGLVFVRQSCTWAAISRVNTIELPNTPRSHVMLLVYCRNAAALNVFIAAASLHHKLPVYTQHQKDSTRKSDHLTSITTLLFPLFHSINVSTRGSPECEHLPRHHPLETLCSRLLFVPPQSTTACHPLKRVKLCDTRKKGTAHSTQLRERQVQP